MNPETKLLQDELEFFSKLSELMVEYSVTSFDVETDEYGYGGMAVTGISVEFARRYDKDEPVRYSDYCLLPSWYSTNELQTVVKHLQTSLDNLQP